MSFSTNRRKLLKSLGAGAVVATSGCTTLTGGGSDEPVKLGFMTGLSGPYSSAAKFQQDGATLAVEEINEDGGLLGREVEMLVRDTELNADTATRRTQDLIQNENVDALAGNLSTGIGAITNDLAKQNSLPFFPGIAGSRPLKENYWEGTFNAVALTSQFGRAGIEYGKQEFGDSVYGVYADYAFGQEIWNVSSEWFSGELGGTVAGASPHPLGAQDFSSQVNAAMDSDADFVFLGNFGLDWINFVNQAREFDLHEEMGIYIPVLSEAVSRTQPAEVWEGIFGGLFWHNSLDMEPAKVFSEKMQDRFGYPGASFNDGLYTGLKEWQRGVESAGTLEVDGIIDALESEPKFQHIKGPQEWRQCDHQAIQDAYTVKGKNPDNVENEWDVWEVVGSQFGEKYMFDCSYVQN